jgi:peptidyl-prolyl cis-trans isomerase C
MPELEHDRLSLILAQAERAGINGALSDVLRDPRLVNVIAGHFRVPSPSMDACLRYYRAHQDDFREPDRYLGRQIVLPLGAGDAAAQLDAWARAERMIAILCFSPRMFSDLLVSYGELQDASGGASGQLGPVAHGGLLAPLDAMFFALKPGEICPAPILTELGVHVIILDRILPGEAVPFAAVHGRISVLLRREMRHAAAARHLARLAARHL